MRQKTKGKALGSPAGTGSGLLLSRDPQTSSVISLGARKGSNHPWWKGGASPAPRKIYPPIYNVGEIYSSQAPSFGVGSY